MTSAGRPATEQRKLVSVAGYAKAAAQFDGSGFRRFIWSGLIRMDHARVLQAQGRNAEAAVRLAEAKAILGPQQGERAERIAALRQETARAVAPMS